MIVIQYEQSSVLLEMYLSLRWENHKGSKWLDASPGDWIYVAEFSALLE